MANRIRLYYAEPAPTVNGAAVIEAGGSLTAGKYAFKVVAWYDANETSYLKCGSVNRSISRGADIYTAATGTGYETTSNNAWQDQTVAANNKVTLSWYAPTLNGVTVTNIDHYSIYYRYAASGTVLWTDANKATKCAVTGYATGNIPAGILTAVITDETELVTNATARIVAYTAGTSGAGQITVLGDIRNRLPPGYTFVSSGNNGGLNDGTFTTVTSGILHGVFGPCTIITVAENVDAESGIINSSAIITYNSTPMVNLHTDGYGGDAFDWGNDEQIEINPVVDMAHQFRDASFTGYTGQAGVQSYAIDRITDGITLTICGSSMTRAQWNQIMLWTRTKCRVFVHDENNSGEYGKYCGYFGIISSTDYIGNTGKRKGRNFNINFRVESEA